MDMPEEEDTHGGALLGMHLESAHRIAAWDVDIHEFKEWQMIRLSMGRKEWGECKCMMRGEMSNLDAIAGVLGSLMASIDNAFDGRKVGRKRDRLPSIPSSTTNCQRSWAAAQRTSLFCHVVTA